MKSFLLLVFLGLATPLLTLAQAAAAPTGGQQTLQGFIENVVLFLSSTIVPFLLSIAFLIFVINVVRFFILQSSNEDGQKNAKSLALYSVLAFVFILIFWGLVNVLVSSFGLSTGGPPKSDYEFPDEQPGIVPPPDDSGTSERTTAPEPGRNVPPGQFTPPRDDWPNSPPPISNELEGNPEPDVMFNGLNGSPGQGNF